MLRVLGLLELHQPQLLGSERRDAVLQLAQLLGLPGEVLALAVAGSVRRSVVVQSRRQDDPLVDLGIKHRRVLGDLVRRVGEPERSRGDAIRAQRAVDRGRARVEHRQRRLLGLDLKRAPERRRVVVHQRDLLLADQPLVVVGLRLRQRPIPDPELGVLARRLVPAARRHLALQHRARALRRLGHPVLDRLAARVRLRRRLLAGILRQRQTALVRHPLDRLVLGEQLAARLGVRRARQPALELDPPRGDRRVVPGPQHQHALADRRVVVAEVWRRRADRCSLRLAARSAVARHARLGRRDRRMPGIVLGRVRAGVARGDVMRRDSPRSSSVGRATRAGDRTAGNRLPGRRARRSRPGASSVGREPCPLLGVPARPRRVAVLGRRHLLDGGLARRRRTRDLVLGGLGERSQLAGRGGALGRVDHLQLPLGVRGRSL